MIYFDNAATTKYKPEEVYKAFEYYVREIGVSPGRGSYQLGIEASRMLFKTRKKIAEYFGLSSNSVIFTKNSTEAINLFFNGYLKQGDHAIITCYEHNAVLRPLHQLKLARIIDYSVVSREDLELEPEEIYEKYAKENTVLFATTLASNLTGRIVFSSEVMEFMKSKGLTTFVDASQGAGKIRLVMPEQNIDYLAFTGHKDLMALPGVGGLCCVERPAWKPLIQGGTGVLGDSYVNPDVFPEEYEAGTLNMPAIWSLEAALEVCTERFEENQKNESELVKYLLDKFNGLEHVIVYDKDYKRVSTVGFNLTNHKSNEVVEFLDRCGICTRGGIHCAILAHEALGTKEFGVVRISMSSFNTKEEIDTLIKHLEDCG